MPTPCRTIPFSMWILALAAAALFPGCEDGPSVPESFDADDFQVIRRGIGFRAELTDAGPDRVRVEIAIANLNDGERFLELETRCLGLLRAYTPGQVRIWDEADATLDCRGSQSLPLERRTAQTEVRTASAATILDDENPPGPYRITAYFQIQEEPVVEVVAGEADLGPAP